MAKYIWRQINVWVWIEWTRGTAVSPAQWIPKTDFSFEEKMETIQDESSIGVIVDSRGTEVIKKYWEWEIGGNIEVNSIGYLLLWTLWTVSSEEDTTWAYKHSFELNNSNQIQSLSIWVSDPVLWDVEYWLWSIESMTISASEWEFATFTVNFRSKPWESTSHTVSYDVDYKLLARHSIFKTATNSAWLDAADNVCLRSFEITFTKNLEDDYCIWSISPEDFINQNFTIEWSFTAVFENDTFRSYALDGTKRAIRFSLVDTDTDIWVSSNPELTIDLPLASFTEFSRSQWNDETVTQTVTFKGLYSNTDSSAVDIDLVNTTADYTA